MDARDVPAMTNHSRLHTCARLVGGPEFFAPEAGVSAPQRSPAPWIRCG